MNLIEKVRVANAMYAPSKFTFDPKWIVLGVNNICNLHCKMCDVGVKYNESNFFQNLMGSKPINMPLELIKQVIDQLHKYYPSCKLGYGFTEPLIYPHLLESLQYANASNVYTSVTTNALNLPRYAQSLMDVKLDELNISLDGLEETHNKIRGHKSSFQKAIKGIELLKNSNIKISIYCVITEWNVEELEDFIKYFKQFSLQNIGFMHMNFTPSPLAEHHNNSYANNYPATASNTTDINIDKINLSKLWEQIGAVKNLNTSFPITFSPDLRSENLLHTYYKDPSIFIGKRCRDIFSNMMIKSNGDVIPAHGRCYNLTIGNMHKQNLKEIWKSEELGRFRSVVSKAGGLLPACSRCCSAFG